ncbi:MAG TPA: RluA family pseudouridine synthase [Candidatus Saccharimonadales bacterium]|nr:RluA family pseudouridine synthase [Candidatus Saccharimonadales bacterium]
MANLEISRAKRLDQKVVELIPELSRASATKLIEGGKVAVNGKVTEKGGYKLREGDDVQVDFDIKQLEAIPEIELEVLYEDDDCAVIVKPAGILTHSKGEFNPEATVETWLKSHIKQNLQNSPLEKVRPFEKEEKTRRAGIVHRLDRLTSGVMICAKTPEALSWLQKQFSQRRVKKTYCAVVAGQLKQPHAIIDMPIERNPKAPATFRVGVNGKSARTEYKVIKESADYSLLELKPETGRTHQLRVHLNNLGHPIVGDTMYDGEPADRLYLHAEELEITLPNRERKVFRTPVPASFEGLLKP